MKFTNKKITALALLGLFISSLVLPIPHIFHVNADGSHQHCQSEESSSKDKHSHQTADGCQICRHVLFAKKSTAASVQTSFSVTITSSFTAPIYKQPIFKVFTLKSIALRAPPAAL